MAERPKRFRLDVSLPRPLPVHGYRNAVESDIPALGELAWAAYRETPDKGDVGDGVVSATEEVRLAFAGEHGPFLPEASFVAEDDGRPVAAALVTVWKGEPLLAYVFTAPAYAGRGLARRLIESAMRAVGEHGYPSLSLAVTERNVRARRLYESLGFVPHPS